MNLYELFIIKWFSAKLGKLRLCKIKGKWRKRTRKSICPKKG